MPEPASPTPPDVIEGYRIGPRLTQCGVLSIHAATSKLDLPVEVYLVPISALTGGFDVDDFLDNVRRAASVHHEALLPFITGGQEAGFAFAVAKSVDGVTLGEDVAKDGTYPEKRALALAASLVGALAALERAGMRHGELSPGRIVVAPGGNFLVRPPRLLPANLCPHDERHQAPEEARGAESGVQSDLFVVGIVLVETMSGANPMPAGPGARRALREWKVPDLTSPLRRASPETRALLARMLAPEPANRFATAEAALRAIEEAARGSPETAPVAIAVAAKELPPPLPARSAPEAPKRTPGRLYVEARLGEAMLEIDDEVMYLGPGPQQNVRVQAETFAEAVIRVERAQSADFIHAVAGELRVNGEVVASRALADGDHAASGGIVLRYERATRSAMRATGAGSRATGAGSRAAAAGTPAAAAPPTNAMAGVVTAVAVLGTLAAIAWGGWRVTGALQASSDARSMASRSHQQLSADRERLGPPEAVAVKPKPKGAAEMERAAREAYDAAGVWRRKSRDKESARAKFREAWQRYPETAYGALALLEAHDIEQAKPAPPDPALEDLIVAADSGAAAGDPEILAKLRNYVEDHPGTIAGERAHVALVKASAVQNGRFEADIAAVRAAGAKKDWREAMRLISKMLDDYQSPSLQQQVRDERVKIEQGMAPPREGSAGAGPRPGAGTKPPEAGREPPTADRNAKAEEIFRSARKLMDGGGKDAEAMALFLTFLREYKDTQAGSRYDPEVRGRINTLSLGPAGIVALFRGKVEKAEKSRWRITYDFEDPKQFADFRDLLAFESPPRASWKVEGSAVRSSRGSGAFVLDAVFAPDEVSASVKVSPDRAHDLGVIFVDPSEQRRFYLYTLQNTFFTLGKGEAAKPFLENAVVLFGPDMWRDTPPGQLGFVRKCGSDEPHIHPAESVPFKAGKTGAEVWMRFDGGRSIQGSAYGDTKYDFPGVTPGVFVLGSGGFFDDFVVEGTPDPEWVRKRWRAIVSGL